MLQKLFYENCILAESKDAPAAALPDVLLEDFCKVAGRMDC